MKKFLLFTLTLCLCSQNMTAETITGSCGDNGDNVTFSFDTETGVLAISGSGAMRDYSSNSSVPWYSRRSQIQTATIEDGVTSIGSYAFYWCSGLTGITIPNGVTSIGSSAFSGCRGLTGITIPNSVTSIGDAAFSVCTGLTGVTIPNSVTSIGTNAFYNCSGLTSIIIPNSVTSIGQSAFSGCSGLTSVTIGESVTSIGYGAFSYCSGLREIHSQNPTPPSVEIPAFYGVSAKIYVPEGSKAAYQAAAGWSAFVVLEEGETVVTGICGADGANLTWSLDTEDSTLTISGTGAMRDYSNPSAPWYSYRSLIQTAVIEEGVTSIGSQAFYYCSGLTSVTIGNSVTSIGNSAFSYCSGLTGVTLPNSVTSIGSSAFSRCTGLTSVTIGNGVTSIGSNAFYYCSGLTSVTIGNSVTSIGDYAFYHCSGLTGITIPNSVTSIGNNAFYACIGLTSITIPNSVTSIGQAAFYGCTGLTSITIGNGVTSIGYSAFSNCTDLTGFTVSEGNVRYATMDGVLFNKDRDTLIAYPNAKSATYVIPDGVTSIGVSAFAGCTGLTEIHSQNPTPPSVGSYAFSGVPTSTCRVYVPSGAIAAYQAAAGWSAFTYILEEEGGELVGVTGVSLNRQTLSLEVGSTSQLTATIAPAHASNKAVSWTSGNPAVATVSASGLVSAIAAGQASITVTTADGNKTATCAVTVYDVPEDTVTVKDSVVYNIIYKDSVVYNITERDSVKYNIKEVDSVRYNITEKDTTVYNITVIDSIVYNIITEDSIDYTLVPDTVYVVTDITGVNHIVTATALVTEAGDGILIQGLEPNAEFSVYTITGVQYYAGTANSVGEYWLSYIDEGLYILFFRDKAGKGQYSKFYHRKQ